MPRHGIGIDISTLAGSEGVVTTIDDFVFESKTSSEATPFPTADRTNRLAYSEDLSQTGVYGRTNVDVASNNTTAPDGTLTAETVTPTTTNGIHTLGMTGTNTVAMSVFAKANGYNMFRFNTGSSSNGRATFDLSDGTIHATSGTFFSKASIEDHGNGWYRCSCVIVGGSATNMTIAIENSSGSVSFAADGTSGIHFWGAQSEDNTETTAYIPTASSTVTVTPALNDTSNVWDFDGRNIMIAEDPEDEGFWEESYPDGATLPELVLNGDYEELGSEEVTNGDFATDSDWSKGTGVTISDGKANWTNTANNFGVTQNGIITSGKTYKISYTVSNYSSGSIRVRYPFISDRITANGTYTATAEATGTDLYMQGETSGDANVNLSIDNVSVKQVDPNDRWTLGTGWSIEDGKLVGTSVSTQFAQQSLTLTSGTSYEVTFSITGADTLLNNNSFRYPYDGAVSNINYLPKDSPDGTYTNVFTSTGSSILYLGYIDAGTFTGTIDNVTVREYAIQPLDI